MENRKTMLIVDDMEINRAILTQFFQDEFHLIEAENGREALDFIKSQPIDIILLDLMMPIMTVETTKDNAVKQTKAIVTISMILLIIVMTT